MPERCVTRPQCPVEVIRPDGQAGPYQTAGVARPDESGRAAWNGPDSRGDGLAGTQDDVEAARVLAVHRLEARFGVPLLELLGRVDTALG